MVYRRGSGAVLDRAVEGNWAAAPSIVATIPGARPAPTARRPAAPRLPRCPEIDCVRDRLLAGALALAELHALEIGVPADHVLCARGLIEEEDYVAALAASLGMEFEPLSGRTRVQCPLSDDQLLAAAATGLLPLMIDGELTIVVAPRLLDSRRLIALGSERPDLGERFRLTTVPRLNAFVTLHGADEIERRAVHGLRAAWPDLSAAGRGWRNRRLILLAAACAAALPVLAAPHVALRAIEAVLGFVFLAWTALRLLGLVSERFVRRKPRTFADGWLPVYTIVVALYREAAAVEGLVAALRALDYPVEKLDIKLVVEADDPQTREAIARLRLNRPFEIIVAPAGGPRTKPKALNAALPFARGSFVAVYDAEDRPERDQLRLALEAFVAGDGRLACVQARLTIDNSSDSWLSRLFTAEYAGLFDVFLPGLAAWRLPLPLGGSSNHFRTAVLRECGAWDPYNVTEDADLGMRLARFGYRTAVIPSSTYEEAPARFGPWLRQRTRWFKGWMQTWLVHTRSPRRLVRELGWPGFAVFQLLVGGTVLAALVHSLFAIALVYEFAFHRGNAAGVMTSLHFAVLMGGYFISGALGLIGLARRGLLGCAWALLLMPLYWLMLSLAAWRALYHLVRDPYRWEKTEHGLAKTSRLKTSRLAGRVQTGPAGPAYRYRFRSAAASSGRRLRLNGATKRPVLSIR
jgi:cellulose synthase/poly-beta-1,6-N-acetylglucosamine synthase-like glycosyltransferase